MLKVVHSATEAGAPVDWAARRKQLRAIRSQCHLVRRGAASPRQQAAALGATAVGIAVLAAGRVLGNWFAVPDAALFVVAAVAGVVCFGLVAKFSALPWSHRERLDNMLNRYEPVDLRAYKALQEETWQRAYLDAECVLEWATLEEGEIWRREPGSKGFVDKALVAHSGAEGKS